MGTDYPGVPTWHDTITLPTDNDAPKAGTFNLAYEPIIDRTTWIKEFHLPDQYVKSKTSNTSGTAYPANIWWSGTHTFAAGKQVTFDGPITMNNPLVANGAAEFNGSSQFDGTSVFNNTVTLNGNALLNIAFVANGTATFNDRVEYSGTTAYQSLRHLTGPDDDANIDAHHADLLIVPDLAQSRTWTLNDPPSNKVVKATVHWPTSSVSVRFTLKSGTRTLASVRSNTKNVDGSVATFYLMSRPGGAGWILVGSNVPKQRLDGSNADMLISAWLYDIIIVPPLTAFREYTLATPPTDHPPFEVMIHWPVQGPAETLAINDDVGYVYAAITSGATTASGVATVVMGWNGTRYHKKYQTGPY